jgi:glutamate--cysteine ligase
VLEIARSGLRNRARLDHGGNDETGFLGILEEIARRGSCPAERLIDRFETEWAGDIDRIFRDCAF